MMHWLGCVLIASSTTDDPQVAKEDLDRVVLGRLGQSRAEGGRIGNLQESYCVAKQILALDDQSLAG